jgi:ABC-type nitrate/sulfonate/bicarbonate transport system ATPase subunit
MKITKTELAIASELIQDSLDEFTVKELKQRIKYLIKQNTKTYNLIEERAEQQYALGDTINMLSLFLEKL